MINLNSNKLTNLHHTLSAMAVRTG